MHISQPRSSSGHDWNRCETDKCTLVLATCAYLMSMSLQAAPVHGGQRVAGQPPAADLTALQALLDQGIQALLAEATAKNVLQPPYGRSLLPDPRKVLEPALSLTEAAEHAVTTSDEQDDALSFHFDYGFNPLCFLGEWLIAHDPVELQDQARQRRMQRQQAEQAQRHARQRAAALVELQEMAIRRRTGILFGPVLGAVDSSGGVLWAKTIRTVG